MIKTRELIKKKKKKASRLKFWVKERKKCKQQ